MMREENTEIKVSVVFEGKQTDRQAFIRLIASKNNTDKTQVELDKVQSSCYTVNTGRTSDMRRGRGE